MKRTKKIQGMSIAGVIINLLLLLIWTAGQLSLADAFKTGYSAADIIHCTLIAYCMIATVITLTAFIYMIIKKELGDSDRKYIKMVLGIAIVLDVISFILVLLLLSMILGLVIIAASIVMMALALSDIRKCEAEEPEGKSIVLPAVLTVLLPLVAVGVFSIAAGVASYSQFSEYMAGIEARLGSFQVSTIDGGSCSSEDIKGHKLAVVNLWGTYCDPCKEEMPGLGELSREYADRDVVFMGICVDAAGSEEKREEAVSLCQEFGVDYINAVPEDDSLVALCDGESTIPVTYFLDEEGRVLKVVSGGSSKEEWAQIIEGYVKD